jgi:hypothetical protein
MTGGAGRQTLTLFGRFRQRGENRPASKPLTNFAVLRANGAGRRVIARTNSNENANFLCRRLDIAIAV